MRWGFLGAGTIARDGLAPAVHAARGAVLQAVASRDPVRAAALSPAGRCHGSYAELLADDDVDAIYIALANDAHVEWTLAALESGRPVLCEKPLALSAGDVDDIAAAADARGLPVVEASWYRWHPRIRWAHELVVDGAVGRVRKVTAAFSSGAVPATGYRLVAALGGGALYDLGGYVISAALWSFGETPVSVCATGALGPTGVDVGVRAVLDFAGGEALLDVGFGEARQALVIEGTRGRIELPGLPFTSTGDLATEIRVCGRSVAVPADDAYRVMVEQVSSFFSGGDGWVLPLAESRACAGVIDSCRQSMAQDGARVPVPEWEVELR